MAPTRYGEGPYGAGPYGGGVRMVWNTPENRGFQTGLDRGVLYPKTGDAVPWSGLIGVEETGAEGVTAYYMDGRPYLFVPKPKEYSATIKAYTYPDAFSRMMGIQEIADGMYLDSQQSESFDFSYRTLIGDGVQGVDRGYKIHLVYNATVVPQALNYDSMSTSINVTSLSWEIQAVPVKVEGYRPTAHIIIDTRNMNPQRLSQLEALLYGNEMVAPSMPAPQTVYDLLSFGEGIVVTLNADDKTFNVEGSYEKVYMLNQKAFQINSDDAIDDAGNGKYILPITE